MSANLSIINEDVPAEAIKGIGNTSNDSGISSSASSDASTDTSRNSNAGTKSEMIKIIIPFKALNGGGRKESTFLAANSIKATCNISGIEGNGEHKNTIDSEGKYTVI